MLYLSAFFIHMIGVVNVIGGFILCNQGGVLYRRATTWEAARSFLTMIGFVPGMVIAGAILLLVSGSYMAGARWGMGAPWVTVGMVTTLLALVIAIFVVNPALRRFRRLTEGKDGPIPGADRRALAESSVWASIGVTNGMALAAAWLMVMKPGWAYSIALTVILGAAAWTVSFLLARAARRRAATS